jgi:hypothetical protein
MRMVGGGATTSMGSTGRLPHIFATMLELPFAADANISVEKDATTLWFVAAAVDESSPTGKRGRKRGAKVGATQLQDTTTAGG